jgi:hypothetical protein
MVPYDLHIAYVQVEDGKYRPVVILYNEETTVTDFKVTSQFASKSESIRSHYLAITDWQEAELLNPSYIDMVKAYRVPIASVRHTPIGSLSVRDRASLIAALNS